MGTMLQVQCPDCALDKTLHVGGGMMSFTTMAAVPAVCTGCKDVVTVNAKLAPPYRCSTKRCGGTPTVMGRLIAPGDDLAGPSVFDWLVDDETDSRYVLPDVGYACPRCGGPRLRFVMAGFWD